MKNCKCITHKSTRLLPLTAFNKNKRYKDGHDYYCRECRIQLSRERYQNDPTSVLKYAQQWQQGNPDKVRTLSQRYRDRNKERHKQVTKRWRDKNKPLTCSLANKRRAQKLQATPSWAEHDKIKALYEEAARLTKETKVKHVVDHYYPLQSPVVCGLHCLANLRIITQAENSKKSNKLLDATQEVVDHVVVIFK